MTTTVLRHGRIALALHHLEGARGNVGRRALLHLHGLGERAPDRAPALYQRWPGPVYALDFTGHGASTIPIGGGYTCEQLMADADAALAHLGEATLVGRGLGAYVATLLAGSRPAEVRGAILADGPGLAGGGLSPGSPSVPCVAPDAIAPPDPWALAELTRDPRPPDYASAFARQAARFSGLAEPISVCAVGRPAWLEAVVAEPGVRMTTLAMALEAYAG